MPLSRFIGALVALALLGSAPLQAQPIPCEDGMAGEFPCENADLLAHLDLDVFGSEAGNDSWGWTDRETGREYAIMCLDDGTVFVDITDPTSPNYLGKLPTHTVPSVWRDAKVYNDYVFVVSEAEGHGMQVFDLTRLRDVARGRAPVTFESDTHYGEIGQSHNVFLNEDTGFAYVVGSRAPTGCAGGLHIVDVRNPLRPTFAGCFAEDGYTHDVQCIVYDGPDARYAGREVCFASNEDTVTIVDVEDKQNTRMLSQAIYPNTAYTHQGWLTEDRRYFIANDELDEMRFGMNTRTLIFDVQDLENPEFVGGHLHDVPAIDHNLYIRDDVVYFSNYRSGLRLAQLGDLAQGELIDIGYFNTYPEDDDPQFSGTWSNYPFFPSGNVVVSDINRGLFVVRPYREAPLAVTGFRASPVGQRTLVEWTLQQDDLARVAVERRTAQGYTDAGMVRTAPGRTTYRLSVELPMGEQTIRLRAVDHAGMAVYSEPMTVQVGGATAAR